MMETLPGPTAALGSHRDRQHVSDRVLLCDSQHMKKTDFSDYTEARARFGAMDKVAGGAGGGDKSTVTFRVPGKTAELFDNFPDPGSGDPNVNQRAALISYGTQARFWDGVLGKKTY